MENATKALTMAGGVLIAIMTIAALLYAASTWGIIPQKQGETEASKQLAAFNQQYESYDRNALYGTDLISVLNKAIDNNENYSVKPGERMYVDVKFKLINDVNETIKIYNVYLSGEITNVETNFKSGILKSDTIYSLSANKVTIDKFFSEFYGSKKKVKTTKDSQGRYTQYEETIVEGSEFKTRIFKCEQTDYDDEGRIKSLYFVEQNINE